MIQETQGRKQYPSEAITEDPKRLETQIRVFKRWLNCLLKQANAREVTDVLDIFRDTKNLYYLCKYLLGQKVSTFKEPLAEDASYLDRAIAMLERLYGHEIATVMQTAVVEISSKQAWDSEAFLREPTTDTSRATCHNLLLLGLDTIWIFIVTVRAGTGPPSNLVGSISSSGSTITRRSFSGHSGSQSHSVNLLSTRSPCVDRWLISQDERLMAWCVAVTEGYSGINIINFTHSWRDGLAFLAIVHQSRPDLFTYGTRLERTVNQNLSLAFHLATAEFATPRLLEPIDMHPEQVDARATATYILEFRKAVERDRKRRSRGILEIQTSAMVQDQSEAGMETANVTVLSRASPTSSASASDTTWLDDELDNDSGEDGNTIRSLPDPDLFDSTIETTLAWLLAMEERFANNDLTHLELVVPQAVEQFSWSNYSDANFRKNLRQLNFLTTDERNDIESLLSSTTERLKKLHEKIVGRVDEAMARFEVHEDLTAHMARRQMAVGRCLRLGNRLIRICRDRQALEDAGETGNAESTDALSEQDREYQARLREKLLHLDPEVIQRQTALLSSRWNNLCRVNQTLGRRITNCLLRRQGILLVAIRLQLEKLEEERSRQAELLFGPSIRELKNQLEVNRCLEEGIEIGEVLAARLDNFIMLVPLHNAEETEREVGLEAIITDLANRWGRLVDWVNTRYAKLQNALLHWRHFEEEYNVLTDWLNERADEASRVSAMARSSSPRMTLLSRQTSLDKASNSPSHTMSRNNSFGRNHCSTSCDDSLMQAERQELIAATEAEIEAVSNYINSHEPRWAQLLASLDRRAQAVREACGDTEEVSRLVESMVERLVNRWSQLDEPEFSVDDWIDRYTRDGNDLNVSPEPEQNARMTAQEDLQKNTNHSTAQVREDFEHGTISKENKRQHVDTLTLPKGSKIPCLDTVPPPSPTGYRAEFEAKAEELLNWLENCAEALELVTMDKNGNPLDASGGQIKISERKANETEATASSENPTNVINRISREVADWRETMQKVLTMGERYREELLEVGESVEELDQLFDEVEERWAYLTSLLTEAERQVRVATNKAQFHEEVSKLLSRPQEETDTGPIKPDNATVASTEAPSEVKAHPAESVTEQLRSKTEQLYNQLSRVEETLQEQLVFANPDDLEDQLLNVRNLLEDLLDEHSNLNDLLEKLDTTKNADLVSRTSAAINRLKSACASLKARLGHTQDLSEKVDFFMNQLEGIEKWLADMRDYLDSVSHAVLPSPTVIQAQMQESCEALKDMETLEPTLQKVSSMAKHLQGYFKEEYQKLLADRLVSVQANWDEVRELTKSNREHLESLLSSKSAETPGAQGRLTNLDALEQTNSVNKQLSLPELTVQPVGVTGAAAIHTSEPPHLQKLRVDVDELERWMTEAKEKLAKFATVETQAELTAMENIIQTLNNEISERRYILAALDTHTAVSMTDQPLSDTVSLLTRAHFADLESAVAAERERLRGAIYYLEDFTTLMNGESRWFDSVSQLVERLKSETYADLPELAEDLESLNRLSEEHSAEDEERLNSLARSLSLAKVMSHHVRMELEAYNKKLAATKDQMNRVQNDLKAIVDCGQRAEMKTQEWETLLLSTVRQLNAQGDFSDLTQSDSNQLAECSIQITGCKEFLAQIERERSQDWGTEPAARLLNDKLELCQRKLEATLNSIQNVLESVDCTTNLEPSVTILKQRLIEVEKQLHLLDIISCTPDELATSTEKVKDLLTNLNELKVQLDHLQKASQPADKKPTDISEKLSSELTTLQERHRNLVMTILTALGRLEDALPLAQKLEQLVATLGNQVDSVEEVTDYLETADCPMSRKDMVQSAYNSLEKICAKDGLVGQILQTMDKLKQLTTVESSLTSSKQFKDIEKRIEGVIATKEAFHRQAEQLEANAAKHPTDSCSHTPAPALEHPVLLGIRPSVSQLIESLVKKESQTPPMLRQLAREIKDHFKSVVLFYRYCLGTNAPLPSVREEEMEVNSHISKGSDYVTTVAERKAVVQIFFRFSNNYLCQQKTHLGDRLRELIVNAGGDGIGYRLQDLLSLQNVWHETNDKLDRRGEHMATLEQQLNAAEQALSEYMACCSTAQRSKCVTLLNRLEETYGWKLTADHDMLNQKTLSDAYFNDRAQKAKIWDESLINKYESQLRTLAQLLNASQLDLSLIKRGSVVDLGAILKRAESRFIQCYQAVEATGQTLDQLKKTNPVENAQIPMDRADPDCTSSLTGDDLMWLKILLEAQKNRFDDYSSHFSFHKNIWQHRVDQWDAFCSCLNNLRAVLTDLRENEDNANLGSRQDIRRRLQYACGQFETLQKIGLGLTQTEVSEISQENGFAEPNKGLQMELEKNYSTEKNPPVVPPRRNSLNRGKQSSQEQDDRAFIRREVNAIRSQLQELCRRYSCLSLLVSIAADGSEAAVSETSGLDDLLLPPPTRTTAHRSAYVNVGALDDEGPPLSISTLEELGTYQNDVEACLRGLAEETHWLINSSGLVPKTLVRRKSDDIRLASTPRSKPTTEAELCFDLLFWHGQTGSDLNGGTTRMDVLEFTPSWLKTKWAELEALIEVTFEHEKQANAWCRKSIHLVRLLRECEGTRTKPAHGKVITRLEASCNRLSEALSLAQTALRRRKLCLTRWQSQLVELDTLLAEIKTLMGSYENTGWGITGETPSDWLADLRQKLIETSRVQDQRVNRDHWLMELDPQNSGLGNYLDALSSSWNKIQAELASTEQSSMKVQVPEHIASQIRALLTEWEMVCVALNLQPRIEQDRRYSQEDRPDSLVITPAVAVVCAPNSWLKDHIPTESVQSPMNRMPGTATTASSLTPEESTSPTLSRIRAEFEQLSRWLTAVANFSAHSRVKLGDRFDQDTMNSQLLHAKLVTSEGSRMDISQIYHPAALQLKIQQFLTELEARKPQLDRISVERDRLGAWNADESLTPTLSSQAENLSELWANTEDQMQRRTLELEEIIADTQKLKDHERDLDRWLTKAEAELDLLTSSKGSGGGQAFDSPRRLPLSPDTSRKRLQDLGDSLALGREKLRNYTHEAESLMTRFQSEDTSKIRKDLEQITDRWDQFNKRLKQTVSSGIERICEDFMLESEKTVGPKGQQTSSFEPRLISASSREKLTEKLDHIDRKVNRIAQMEIDLKRQHGMVDESVNVTEQRSQLINELQALQTEINNLSAQITGGTMLSHEDMNLLPDSEFLTRWRQLRDKVASLRQTVQTSSGQAHLFLARLKEMNNWVAHRDAAFRATICPLSGNLLFILKLRETMLNLFKEIEAHRPQIEDVLQQGLVQYGDERSETGLGCDSELESDASDMAVHGSSQRQDSRDSTGDDQSKQRVIRRIRRYLYHLRKRWLALNSSMLEYKQKLDAVSDRLSNFQSMFNDVVEQVRSAHAVALRWMPVDCLPVDRIGTELEQAKSFYEACDPLVILLNNLDRQIVQFHDSQIALDPHIITQQAALRNDFDQVRFLTEARIRALSQTLVSIQAIDQRTQPQLTRSPSHRTPIEGGRYTGMDDTENFVNGKMESPVPMQAESVPLSDSVSPPWERCVHPSGTQVPYYKNHASQDTQWDHPILSDLMQSMKQMNAFRFAEYRTALKLRKLQKTLCLDSLSISILAENLKHIGHSQPIDEHNQDPFDRTINVPQMIDCLLDLFSCANGMFGLSDSQGTPVKQQAGGDWAASQQKTGASAKYSTLPSTRSSDTDALHQSRVTPTKCGKGFRRHSSTIRDQQRTSRDPASARPLISSPVPGGVQPTSPLTPGTRCASLPESVTFTATASPVHRTGSDRTRRSTRKGKRHFLVGPTRLPVHVCVDLTLNWLLNVYDRMRKGNVRALSFKVALTTLSVANLDEKYRYLFSLIADPNGCVTEQRLYALLCECILIPRNLGEGGWIGKEDFASTVKHCFEQVAEIARSSESGPHFSPRNIPVRHFLTWLRFGPKTIIWLPLLHRIMLAEQVVHNVRCGVCQRQPLTGLRYRCLRCLNFDLCQQCFFCGWTARSHKLSHPMQEYCTNSTSGDSFRDFTRIVRNRLRSRDRGGQRADSEQTSITTRYSRGRSTCCDANSFGEDKPRPAPTFGPDLVSLLPRDSALLDSSPFKRNDWSKGGDSIGTPDDQIVCSQAQAPVASEPPVSRPSSSQVPYSPEYRLPPRAASDTRQFQRGTLNDGTGVTGRSTFPKSHFSRLQHTNAIDIDDEHNLIAQYSNELRQQSEPELNPVQQMVSSTHSAVPTIMDRSTISDGIPCTPVTALGNEALPAHAGHSSLDRRQLGRLTGGQTYLSYSGPQNGSLDVQPSYYPGAPYPYPLSSNPALPRMISHESHLIPNIQRSYSLRARSQPPPDVHGFRHNFGPNFDPRSPWPPALQPANYHGNSDQTVRTLEDERKLLQMEYDRLRQRTNTPTYLPSSSSSRLQTQQAQQRFARMQLQHQLMHQQQQQDPMRASLARPYLPRIPLHRPPSVGSAFPNGSLNTGQPTITGRVSYGGSLGRSKNTSNGFGYLIDSYGSEPRVGGYPYGFEAGGMDPMSTNQTAVSSELAIEARRLREHRGRLEVRMQQLEDQNKQLEHKLQRLRQYLISGGTASGAGGASGTNKIPTELLLDRINANSKTSLRQRSASGGLASQAHPVDGKAYRGSGSVGQLMGPASLEIKQAGTKTPVNSIDRSQQEEQNKITSTPQDYYQVPVDDSFPVITSPGPRTDDIHATFRPTLLRSDSNQY